MSPIRYIKYLRENEPVRLVVYPVIVIFVGLLVARGLVTESIGDLVLSAVALLIGATATEQARAKVFAPATVEAIRQGQVAGGVVGEIQGAVAQAQEAVTTAIAQSPGAVTATLNAADAILADILRQLRRQ